MCFQPRPHLAVINLNFEFCVLLFFGRLLLHCVPQNQAFVSLQSKLVTQKAKPFVQTSPSYAAHPYGRNLQLLTPGLPAAGAAILAAKNSTFGLINLHND